jgi:Phosphotransferase enzyme family
LSTPVIDPFGVADDRKMPFLAGALNPLQMQRQFERCLSYRTGDQGQIHLRAIRVVRYKPERRCLIEYDLEVVRPDAPADALTLLGKARAKGLDRATYEVVQSLWRGRFGADSEDGIHVPEPIGVIPAFHMWLQCKVEGVVATELVAKPGGVALASRIAEAAYKLQQAGILPRRCHTMVDELRILRERLSIVAQMKPLWAGRLQRLLEACDRLGAATPGLRPRGIHRDLYADQVLVNGSRLYLLDFDLYCLGDPGLDVGNFLGHLTEQSLRTAGHPDGLANVEEALEERFVALCGEAVRTPVQAYATLTLVRHIWLSTQFSDRRPFTEPLLELCEQRLGLAGRGKTGKPAGIVGL